MRGSPLLRALLAFLVLLGFGVPIWRLSRVQPTQMPEVVGLPKETQLKEIRLRLDFTAQPTGLRVLHLGKEIWADSSPGLNLERPLTLAYPKEGIDLVFQLQWPADKLAALRVRLTDPEGEEHEKTVWGEGAVTEVVSIP
jgi:hypothetical protein